MKRVYAAGAILIALAGGWATWSYFTTSSRLENPRVTGVLRPNLIGSIPCDARTPSIKCENVPETEWWPSPDHPARVNNNDYLVVQYDVWRLHDCSLSLKRYLKSRETGKYYLIHSGDLSFKADDFKRPSSFRAQVRNIEKPKLGEDEIPPGIYDLIPIGRYFCFGPDWYIPRYNTFESIPVEIVR